MTENKIIILWADDELQSLKPQIMFLEKRDYEVIAVSNGHDAVTEIEKNGNIDVVLLDESMPGITGLETLKRIKNIRPNLPVIMVTKNEQEDLMEEAIGSQIADYLLKPVNPVQVLSALRKITDSNRLIREKTTMNYQQEFRNIFMSINDGSLDFEEWVGVYKKIIRWELELDRSYNPDMSEILSTQKYEANAEFAKFISKNYVKWFRDGHDAPTLSHNLLKNKVLPHLNENKSILLVLDNLRYDQWLIIQPILEEMFRVEEEDYFYSILPSATQYSRNAIFAGLTPLEISKKYPNKWLYDHEEGGKNLHEDFLLGEQLKRVMRTPVKHEYFKVTNANLGKQLEDNILNMVKNNNLIVIVYNFIDMLSHARTEMEVLKELAGDEKSYRDLTRTWFINSPLWTAIRKLSDQKLQLFVTTDHGTIRVNKPSKVLGDRETTTNLRYKVGRNLQYEREDVLDFRNPAEIGLPSPNISSTFIFGKNDVLFLYPNNYTHFNNYYRNTFQHGGISLEELIVPIIRLKSK